MDQLDRSFTCTTSPLSRLISDSPQLPRTSVSRSKIPLPAVQDDFHARLRMSSMSSQEPSSFVGRFLVSPVPEDVHLVSGSSSSVLRTSYHLMTTTFAAFSTSVLSLKFSFARVTLDPRSSLSLKFYLGIPVPQASLACSPDVSVVSLTQYSLVSAPSRAFPANLPLFEFRPEFFIASSSLGYQIMFREDCRHSRTTKYPVAQLYL